MSKKVVRVIVGFHEFVTKGMKFDDETEGEELTPDCEDLGDVRYYSLWKVKGKYYLEDWRLTSPNVCPVFMEIPGEVAAKLMEDYREEGYRTFRAEADDVSAAMVMYYPDIEKIIEEYKNKPLP